MKKAEKLYKSKVTLSMMKMRQEIKIYLNLVLTNLIMVLFMKVNGKMVKDTAEEFNTGQTVQCMKDIGEITWHKAKVD